jgi:hypothetical protein
MNCLAWLCQLGAAGPAGVMSADMADIEQKMASAISFFFIGFPVVKFWMQSI